MAVVIMHEFTILKAATEAALSGTNLRLLHEELHPEAFGSAYAVYGSGEPLLRLVWDGKDGWGFVQRRAGDDWQDDDYLFRKGAINEDSLAEFRIHITNLLGDEERFVKAHL